MKSALACLITCLIINAPPAFSENDSIYYRISGKKFNCLRDNTEKYLGSTADDLIFVAIDHCPNIPKNPILAVTRNENPSLKLRTSQELDRLLTFTRTEINCISGASHADIGSIVLIYAEECRIIIDE